MGTAPGTNQTPAASALSALVARLPLREDGRIMSVGNSLVCGEKSAFGIWWSLGGFLLRRGASSVFGRSRILVVLAVVALIAAIVLFFLGHIDRKDFFLAFILPVALLIVHLALARRSGR